MCCSHPCHNSCAFCNSPALLPSLSHPHTPHTFWLAALQVHSGADLQASASAASGHVPGAAKGYLGYVLANSNGHEILPLIEAAVEARAELQPVLRNSRDVLYLDLALENVVRAAAERGVGSAGPRTAALVAPLLQNLALSLGDNEEVCYCLKAWQDLPEKARSGQVTGKDDALRVCAGAGLLGITGLCSCLCLPCVLCVLCMLCCAACPHAVLHVCLRNVLSQNTTLTPPLASLKLVLCFPDPLLPRCLPLVVLRPPSRPSHSAPPHPSTHSPWQAMAVIERVRRALAEVSDGVSQTVGPVSQQFGQAFGCESWAVTVSCCLVPAPWPMQALQALMRGWVWVERARCMHAVYARGAAWLSCSSAKCCRAGTHQMDDAPFDAASCRLLCCTLLPPPSLPGSTHMPVALTACAPPPLPLSLPLLQLFPEEVVRGGPAFAVSLALTAVEAHFRSVAEMGAWQVISPAACWGKLEVVPDLHDIQEKVGGGEADDGRGGAH